MDEKIVLRSWHPTDFINREIFRLCVKLRERSGRFEIDGESFSLIVSFLRSSDHERLSAAISLLDTACLYIVYKEQFLQSLSGVKNLMHVLDLCTDNGVLCKAWNITYNLLRLLGGHGDLTLLTYALCHRFHQLLNVETLGNMNPDVRDSFARALGCYLPKEQPLPLIEKLVNLSKCEDCDILQFTWKILKGSFKLTYEAVNVLIALTKHDEPKIRQTAVTLLLDKSQQITTYPQAATAVLDYLEMNPQYLNDLAVRGMANLTVEESVRDRLKHSGVLEKILFYGLEKGIIETVDVLMNFKNDQDVIDLCANDITFLKLLIEVVIEQWSHHGILNLIMSSSKINRDIASCASLKMFLGECSRYYPVLKAILRSNQLTKEVLLSGLCSAIDKADRYLTGSMNTSSAFDVAKILLCEPENKRIVMLSLPIFIRRGEMDFWKEYLMDMGGLNFLMTELETNPTDDAVAYALFIISDNVRLTFGKENFPVQMKCCIQKRETRSLVQRSSQIHQLPTCGEPSGETVTIFVDAGDEVHWDRHQLSKISPVFDAMLNGSFIEARQDNVQFPDCSAAALTALFNMVTGKCKIDDISVGIRLQLAELAERLLIPGLGHTVALSFLVNTENIVDVYEWFWNRGYLIDSMWSRYIGVEVYEILLRDYDHFQRVLRNDSTQELLISDVKELLQNLTSSLTHN